MAKQLNWVQIRIVALCMSINMLDGFDILAMAYAAPAVADQWRLDPEQLGILFSLGLGGMMAGSIFIGPMADRFGRRPVIIGCLVGAIAAMTLAGFSADLTMLAIARLLTGFAIGGTLPTINTMVAEYATPRSRTISVSLTQAGFPIGASLGGFLAVWLLGAFGWQSVFWAGALISAILLPIILLWMPESAAFARSGRPEMRAGSEPAAQGTPVERTRQFESLLEFRAALAVLTLSFGLAMMGFYFLTSWLPKILVDVGMAEGDAVFAGSLLTSGGIFAALGLGWLAMNRALVKLIAAVAALAAILTFLVGQIAESGQILFLAAFVLGVMVNAVLIGLYAAVPGMFPVNVRGSGTGLAIGLGRGGAVLAPWLAGVLIAQGWVPSELFALMALPYVGVAILVLILGRWQRY